MITKITISVSNAVKNIRGIIALNAIANHPSSKRNPLSNDNEAAISHAVVSSFVDTALSLMPYVTDLEIPEDDPIEILSFDINIPKHRPRSYIKRFFSAAIESIVVNATVGAILADIDRALAQTYRDRAILGTTNLRLTYLATPPDPLHLTPWD